jgi:hypothetical protein
LVQRRPDDRDEGVGRKAVDKKTEVGYEDGMAENNQAVDLVQELLAATFGPNTAAEVAKDEGVEPSSSGIASPASAVAAHDVEATPSADDGGPSSPSASADVGVSDLPKWWKFNLDGTPRKRCQAPTVLKGVPHGETRQRETDLLMLKALHEGCETLVELVAHTGCVKVTVVRSLERLVGAGRVVQSKAPPSGKRGRPAFIYRPTTTAPVETSGEGETDLRSVVVPDTVPVDAAASTAQGVEE